MTSYILHYNSKSHGAKAVPPVPFITRYFVGSIQVPCIVHGYHDKPSWDYEKENSTILDGKEQAQGAKAFATACGYTDLQLSPLDEDAPKIKTDKDLPVTPEVIQ